MIEGAIVLYSGGLDSSTCLAIARERGFDPIIALSFNYGQQHDSALDFGLSSDPFWDHVQPVCISLPKLGANTSALVSRGLQVPMGEDPSAPGIPATYVPARNLVFLAHAVSMAEDRGIRHIFIGANELDFSGYPDCRDPFFEAFEAAANVGTSSGSEGAPFEIHRPLIRMSKADIVRGAIRLGVPLAKTMSCYKPQNTITEFEAASMSLVALDHPGLNLAGKGTTAWHACGECDSCQIRLAAFVEVGVPDPVPYLKNGIAGQS